MSPDHRTPVEYSAAQINTGLAGGVPIDERDAVGHGTVTAGLAAGNGSAVTGADFRGMAPNADLIIVKVTSEGAPAHGSQPAETPFNASYVAALDWVDQKITLLGVGVSNKRRTRSHQDGQHYSCTKHSISPSCHVVHTEFGLKPYNAVSPHASSR